MSLRVHTASLTRPADTTAYAAGDVVTAGTAAALSFGLNTSAGRIRSALLIDSASQATKPDIDLMLFDSSLTPDADNAAFTPTDAEMGTLIGVISFAGSAFKTGDATVGAGGNGVIVSGGLDILLSGASETIYGVLVARNAYTPVASEVFTIRLGVET